MYNKNLATSTACHHTCKQGMNSRKHIAQCEVEAVKQSEKEHRNFSGQKATELVI